MRVKRLEIQGFKSFKDKTVIHFDHSITGIVGPNGCGKSNIVDAFFWVMGEQSYKHMRGAGSDDLIFNGSTKYSPLGMAEATLVLETDVPDLANGPAGASYADIPVQLKTKETSVTRRVYRDGSGEYFINGVPARLKDIHELFMDTGVGAKGYSVIEQGQIGKIVNSKPEERRLLIEEAAGIAKYKSRKKESLRKMEATQANLARLTDVIQEIERNLGSLERQAQKARQYKKIKSELLDQELTWGRRKQQVLNQSIDGLQKEREALEQELVSLRSELQRVENAIEVDRISQITATKGAEGLQSALAAQQNELTQKQSALELSRRRQSDLAAQIESFRTESLELRTSIADQQDKLTAQETEYLSADQTLIDAQLRAQNQDEIVAQARRSMDECRKKVDQLKRDLMKGISQSSELNSRGASLAQRIENALAQAERLSLQIEAQRSKLQSLEAESTQISQRAQEITHARDEAVAERQAKSAEILLCETHHSKLVLERDEKSKSYTQAYSKLQSLRELDEAYEGFGDAPKAVMEWCRSQATQHPLRAVTDSLLVRPEYEAALEGWLEGQLQNLISEDPDLALSALQQIKNLKKGRASIHVSLESPRGTTDISRVRNMLVNAGFEVESDLSSFVKIRSDVSPIASGIAQQLISHVFVVKSLAPVAEFLRQKRQAELEGWSIVALDGAVLDSRGILRGGSTESGQAASVLGRKRAIGEWAALTSELEQELTQASERITESQAELDVLKASRDTLNATVQNLEIEAAATARDVSQSLRWVREAQESLAQQERDLARAQQDVVTARDDRAAIEVELMEMSSLRSAHESQIAEQEAVLLDLEQNVRDHESAHQALRIQEASLKERAQSLRRELEANRSVIVDRERRLGEIERSLNRTTQEQAQFSDGDSELQTKTLELVASIGNLQGQYSLAKDLLEKISTQLNGNLDQIKVLHANGNEKTAKCNLLAIDAEKLSGERSYLIQSLEERYGVGCLESSTTTPIQEEMSEPIVTREMTAEEELLLGEEVERLRERLRRLGEVNTMAIEEFEEMHRRFETILAEKRDLETSISNLNEAIEHINVTSEARFKKAFDAIGERFQRLFPIIFGGGSAELSLVFPEGSTDVLEAGVDILAQPPGKRVSNITLLSGGEKALTAVSLIFAIFMVKPSPFCVLDEVDAPLDDANIGKFNALLKEMSIKSQFILITHNKKTMELNDTLYGVTMEEPGVSKMVSIEMH